MARKPESQSKDRCYLKEWREKRGLTQEELAARININRSALSRYEGGQREPPLRLLFQASRALSLDPSQLLVHPDAPSAGTLLGRLSPEQQRRLLDALRDMMDVAVLL